MTPSEVIALAAVISTAAVAIVGLGLQALLAWRQRVNDRRQRRHDELIRVYAEVGAELATRLGLIRKVLRVSADPKEWQNRLHELAAEGDRLDEERVMFLLALHRAAPPVMMALHAYLTALTEVKATLSVEIKRLDGLLSQYHVAAGDHARAVLAGKEK